MKRIGIPQLILVLVLGTALWLGFRAMHPQPAEQLEDSSGTWQQVYPYPVRSLAAAGEVVVLGTYQDSVVLHADGTTTRIAAGLPSADSPWAGVVFALAVDPEGRKVYEGRDQAHEVSVLDLREDKWQPFAGFADSERWTVWSLTLGDALYAGTGKGVWMRPLESNEAGWELIGPPAGRARLPVFSLLHTEGGLYAGTFDGIWLYTGGEWQRLADGPRGKVLALAAFTWNGQRYLAAGTGAGLFIQSDAASWQRVKGDYADDPVVYSVVFDATGGFLFAGTADGVLRLDMFGGDGSQRWEKVGLSGPVMVLAWNDGALVAGGDAGAFIWTEGR
jgi:hypothetical protein